MSINLQSRIEEKVLYFTYQGQEITVHKVNDLQIPEEIRRTIQKIQNFLQRSEFSFYNIREKLSTPDFINFVRFIIGQAQADDDDAYKSYTYTLGLLRLNSYFFGDAPYCQEHFSAHDQYEIENNYFRIIRESDKENTERRIQDVKYLCSALICLGKRSADTLLLDNILEGNLQIVKFLVEEKGADINAKDRGYPYLHLAITEKASKSSSKREIIKYLVEEKNADIHAVDDEKNTVLHKAALVDSWIFVDYFLRKKIDVLQKNKQGISPLDIVLQRSEKEKIIHRVLDAYEEKGNNINILLLRYALKGCLFIVSFLIEKKGANIHASYNNRSVLRHAAKSESFELVQYLVENGANIHEEDELGETILHRVCLRKNISMMYYLLSKGADPYHKNLAGKTPFNIAEENKISHIIDRWQWESKMQDSPKHVTEKMQRRLEAAQQHQKSQVSNPLFTKADKFIGRERRVIAEEEKRIGRYTVQVASAQGTRAVMEDTYLARRKKVSIGSDEYKCYFFAVFDGHGIDGNEVASYCKKHFVKKIIKNLQSMEAFNELNIHNALTHAVLEVDAALIHMRGGSTASLVMVVKKKAGKGLWENEKLFAINVGDSRSVLITSSQQEKKKNGFKLFKKTEMKRKATQLTEDAKFQLKYVKSIEKRGGVVTFDRAKDKAHAENQGGFGLSRSIGGHSFSFYLSARPTITEYPVAALDTKAKIFIATDGLWGMASTEQVKERILLQEGLPIQNIATHIVARALRANVLRAKVLHKKALLKSIDEDFSEEPQLEDFLHQDNITAVYVNLFTGEEKKKSKKKG